MQICLRSFILHTLFTSLRASLLFALILSASLASAQQRLAQEGVEQRGWVEEAIYDETFIASATLSGALWSRFDETVHDQAGLEGVISARLKGAVDDETFLQLHTEFIVPLMFALNDAPTQTQQWWHGRHNAFGQLGFGDKDGAGFQLSLEGHFNHTQEPSGVGLSFAYIPTDLDEEILAITARPRFSPFGGGVADLPRERDARWHLGVPLQYRHHRVAYGSANNPIDKHSAHELSVAFDARSIGKGAIEGRVEAIKGSWRHIGVEPSGSAEPLIGLTAAQSIDRLGLELLGADLMLRADSGILWRAVFNAGFVWLINNTEDDTDALYALRLGGTVAEPQRYELSLFLKVAEPYLAPDPRATVNGSRLEVAFLVDPQWFGTGFTQRSAVDLACDFNDGLLCYDGDSHRVHLLNEAFWPIAGGDLGMLYRTHYDNRDLTDFDWTLKDNGGDWIHEVGVFWRMRIDYDALDPNEIRTLSKRPAPTPSEQ